VLVHDLCEHARRTGRAEPHDAHEPAQLAQDRAQDRQSCTFDDPQVELLVEIEERVGEPFAGDAPLTDQEQPQVVDVLGLHHLAGPSDGDAFERLAEQQDLGPVLGREAADDQLSPRADFHEAFAEQQVQRVADRGA
jgi:hypothetical protein